MDNRECGGIARQRQQKHNNGGFRHFATWTVSHTCATADIVVWLFGLDQTIEGERFCYDWALGVMLQNVIWVVVGKQTKK